MKWGRQEWEAARRKAPWLSTHWGQSKASSHGPQPLISESLEELGRSHLLPPVPTPQPRQSRRAGLAAPRAGPGCLPRKHGWLEHPRRARRAGAFRGGTWPAPAGGARSEVGNLNARAGGKCSASRRLPGAAPSFLLPSPFPSFPLLLISFPASPLSHSCPASFLPS